MAANGSRPQGHYAKYKRATQHFLLWLQDARSLGIGSVSPLPSRAPPPKQGMPKVGATEAVQVSLARYETVVNAIVKEPTVLTPALLGRWSRALAACESSITLREQFAIYFPSTNKATVSHAHFVDRLRSWLAALRSVEVKTSAVRAAKKTDASGINFSNYYDVLSLADDYFTNEDSEGDRHQPTKPSSRSKDAKTSVDDAFANDLDMELASLFAELDELVESVYCVYADVKLQKKTLVEAAVVTKVAIECAKTVIASLQVLYPSISTADDLVTLMRSRMTGLADLEKTMIKGWATAIANGATKDSYMRGAVIVDLVWLTQMIVGFTTIMPKAHHLMSDSALIIMGTYDEETTQQSMVPNGPLFIVHQLTFLYNVVTAQHEAGVKIDRNTEAGWYFYQFSRFFRTKTLTIDVVFICICWLRSVTALQGDGGITRNVGHALVYIWGLQDRLSASIDRGHAKRGQPALYDHMCDIRLYLGNYAQVMRLMRANPFFTGIMMFDNMMQYLRIASVALIEPGHFRAFGNLYSALCERKLLKPIPFLEGVMTTYERAMFATTRADVKPGSFSRSYRDRIDSAVSSKDVSINRDPKLATPLPSKVPLSDLQTHSQVARLLQSHDYAWLPSSWSSSWHTLLTHVSDLTTSELFDSRVLSRDLWALSDNITDFFNALCDQLGYHGPVQHEVVDECLVFLDTVQLKSPADVDLKKNLFTKIFDQFFAESGSETTYFTLPPSPAWSCHVYGDQGIIRTGQPSEKTVQNARLILDWLAQRTRPLTATQLDKFKGYIRSDPLLLKVMTAGDQNDVAFASIFHHAVAGLIRDVRLVEWLIGMGALYYESSHCRAMKAVNKSSGTLPNAMAVHCAAANGCIDILRHVLEAGAMRDLDTVTFRTQDSLMHLAAKHGHWSVCRMLEVFCIDVTKPNAAGKYAYDYARSNVEAYHRIVVCANRQRQGGKSKRTATRRANSERSDADIERAKAERLHAALAKDQALQRGSTHVAKNKASKKTIEAAARQKQIEAVRDELEAVDDASSRLRGMLEVMKHIKNNKPATSAVLIVDALHDMVQKLVELPVDELFTSSVRNRVACEAMEVVYVLHRYHRQLRKTDLATDANSSLYQLQQRASVSEFWVSLAVSTNKLLLECERRAQATELIEAMERRMAKVTTRPPDFAKCVQLYVTVREAAGLSPRIASTAEVEKQFEPFLMG